MELIIKFPDKVCLDGEVTLNGETFNAENIHIDMYAAEEATITATFHVDKINVVYGYPEIKEK